MESNSLWNLAYIKILDSISSIANRNKIKQKQNKMSYHVISFLYNCKFLKFLCYWFLIFIPFRLENTMILFFFNVLQLVLTYIWSALENSPCVCEKNVYSEWSVLRIFCVGLVYSFVQIFDVLTIPVVFVLITAVEYYSVNWLNWLWALLLEPPCAWKLPLTDSWMALLLRSVLLCLLKN